MNSKELKENFNLETNFLTIEHLKKAIPEYWRTLIKSLPHVQNIEMTDDDLEIWIEGSKLKLRQLDCKTVYRLFLNNTTHKPTCIKKWSEHIPNLQMADDETWQHIFYCPFKTMREVKLQSFQFKITNRIINTNKQLYIWNIKESPICNYCDQEDDLVHFFISCDKVRQFWRSLVKWWNNMGDIQINLLAFDIVESILFGYRQIDVIFKVLNFIFINAKYYIYVNRLYKDNNISLSEFLIILKHKLTVEKNICHIKGDNFKPFLDLMEYLG
jgi:hypothetical protein